MEAAEALFAEKGFNGTSVRDIAEKAGINLAMISYYFGSKDKLLEALFVYRGEQTKLVLEDIVLKKGISALDKVFLMIDHYIEKVFGQKNFHRIMVREQSLNATTTVSAEIVHLKKRNYAVINRLLQDGQKSGEFKKGVDMGLMMTTLFGTVNHLVTTQYYYKQLHNLEHLSDEAFQKQLQKKLTQHLKFLFKTVLTNEA